jgi:glycosyltransferase involved in cell wall biosynthesis
VVVPLYNQASVVLDAIDSAFATSGARIEVVVVDDHSTDGSGDAVRRRMTDFPQTPITLVSAATHRGLASARNTGFRHARADRVFLLHAGGVVFPTGLAKLSTALDSTDAVFAYGIVERFGVEPGLDGWLAWDVPRLCQSNFIDGAVLIRRAIWAELGGYDPGMNKDSRGWAEYDFWLGVAASGKRGVLVPDIVARSRCSSSSMLSAKNPDASSPLIQLRDRYPTLPWAD